MHNSKTKLSKEKIMYICADMGSSNTRLALCDGNVIIASERAAFGALNGKHEGKEFLFSQMRSLTYKLLSHLPTGSPVPECIMISGMAGSEIGLCEIPHALLPANASILAASLSEITIPEICDIPFVFVPGLKALDGQELRDIMRGEEVEAIGTFLSLGLTEEAVLLLPGTHNKAVKISADGMISDFITTLSGEMLSMVISHSILSGSVAHDFALREEFLFKGAKHVREYGLNASLFHIRVMSKNSIDRDCLSSFLYGAVLGEDVEAIKKFADGVRIFVGGKENLRRAYSLLLGEDAIETDPDISQNSVFIGLSHLYSLRKDTP
jgi:2-dehydro-3-deoxygalactonokinase